MKKELFIVIFIILSIVGMFWLNNRLKQIESEDNKQFCLMLVKSNNESYWKMIKRGEYPPMRNDFWMYQICAKAGIDMFKLPEYEETQFIREKDLCPIREKLGLPLIVFCIK